MYGRKISTVPFVCPAAGSVKVPLLATVTAGQPILAVEDVEEYIPFQTKYGDGSDLFALRVKGESMVNAGILDGDVIVARRETAAYNGEIVVALIEDVRATVKRFFKENGHYRLQPENDTMRIRSLWIPVRYGKGYRIPALL